MHCLSIESLSKTCITELLVQAQSFIDPQGQLRRVDTLGHHTLANLFFEPSTRTRSSFTLAMHNLGGQVLNIDEHTAAYQKGETVLDTIENLAAMGVSFFAIRHPQNQMVAQLAKALRARVHLINAGDGTHAHPTQALGDLLTLQQYQPDFSQLTVAVVGDIAHSRVARSQIQALSLFGVKEIRLIGPKALMPTFEASGPVRIYHDLPSGLAGVHVVVVLRIQKERFAQHESINLEDFVSQYGVNEDNLKSCHLAKDFVILHPGPVNRGIELSASLADHPRHSRILQQVRNGVAMRMSVLSMWS